MKEGENGHIDRLFREGLNVENHPVPFRESDWEMLEQRLNRHAYRKRILFWLRPLGGVAALLLLAFAGWWLWPGKEMPVPPDVVVSQEAPETEEGKGRDSVQTMKEKSLSVVEVPKDSKSLLTEPGPKIAVLPVEKKEASGKKPSVESGQRMMTPIASRGSISNLVADQGSMAVSKLDQVGPVKSLPLPPPKHEKPVVPLKLEDEPGENTMAITVLAAPAYNGVNNLNNAKIGGDFGIMFSVAVSKRWSVSTGAIYALKLYEADGESYNPATDGGYGYSPSLVHADCRVLDVPLNVDYRLLNFPKTSFSLGTGVSSYFMLSEKYSYQFAYGPEQKDAVSLKNNSIHWFSVLNLQATLTRRLSPKISISLQPYLKVPFEDIGYGRVRLQSFGLALGTSLNF